MLQSVPQGYAKGQKELNSINFIITSIITGNRNGTRNNTKNSDDSHDTEYDDKKNDNDDIGNIGDIGNSKTAIKI